jgi:hypothetical protein
VLILLCFRTLDASRHLHGHGHGRAISLATIFDEHYPMLRDMACGADERMVLDNTDSAGVCSEEEAPQPLTTPPLRINVNAINIPQEALGCGAVRAALQKNSSNP